MLTSIVPWIGVAGTNFFSLLTTYWLVEIQQQWEVPLTMTKLKVPQVVFSYSNNKFKNKLRHLLILNLQSSCIILEKESYSTIVSVLSTSYLTRLYVFNVSYSWVIIEAQKSCSIACSNIFIITLKDICRLFSWNLVRNFLEKYDNSSGQ